jgi:hypothetical protein
MHHRFPRLLLSSRLIWVRNSDYPFRVSLDKVARGGATKADLQQRRPEYSWGNDCDSLDKKGPASEVLSSGNPNRAMEQVTEHKMVQP